MDSGLTIKPVVSVHVAAPVRIDPPPLRQAVATQLPPEKSVTSASASAAARESAREGAKERRTSQRDNTRDIVIDEETKQVIYRVVNARSGEVVRQVPEESALRLQAYVRALTESDDAQAPHRANLEA